MRYPSRPEGLTERQAKVRDVFWQAVLRGEPCGAIAVARSLGLTRNGIASALQALQTRNLIPRRPNCSALSPTEWAMQVPDEYLTKDVPEEPTAPEPTQQELAAPRVSVPRLPSREQPLDELLAARRAESKRRATADGARLLVPVTVSDPKPIGIVHMGDPHVDDPGCDFALLERHVQVIAATDGLLAANVGDQHNNWVGRLAYLYGQQGASAREAWMLVEWLVTSLPWLYLIRGNHDCWSGAGDPLEWLRPVGAQEQGVMEPWGVRLELRFPNGRKVRINARHDFSGHSMWNTAHGPMRAAQQGWRDHILVCGHRHVSGYGVIRDPASGLISHALRVAGYKVWDDHAQGKLGLPNQAVSPAFVTIIDPRYTDSDPRLITTLFDVEEAAEYLAWKRRQAAA